MGRGRRGGEQINFHQSLNTERICPWYLPNVKLQSRGQQGELFGDDSNDLRAMQSGEQSSFGRKLSGCTISCWAWKPLCSPSQQPSKPRAHAHTAAGAPAEPEAEQAALHSLLCPHSYSSGANTSTTCAHCAPTAHRGAPNRKHLTSVCIQTIAELKYSVTTEVSTNTRGGTGSSRGLAGVQLPWSHSHTVVKPEQQAKEAAYLLCHLELWHTCQKG